MSFLKGVTDIFRGDDDDDDVDESGFEEQEEEETSKPKRLGAKERSTTEAGRGSYSMAKKDDNMEVQMIEPSIFDDGALVSDALAAGKVVVLNLQGTHAQESARIVDYVSGVTYSMHGSMQKVSNTIYIITPVNVKFSGGLDPINRL